MKKAPTLAQRRPIAVARDVQAAVVKGGHPNIGKISLKHGYSPSSARHGKVQKTKAFKEAMASFVDTVESVREASILRASKTVKKAAFRDAVKAVESLTKVHQLLTGGATENIAVGVKALSDAELEALVDGEKK